MVTESLVYEISNYFTNAKAITTPTKVQLPFTTAVAWTYVCIGVVGILSNLFILLVVLRSKELKQQPRNWLMFHQCTADLLSACFLISNATKSTTDKLWVCTCYVYIKTCSFKLVHFAHQHMHMFVIEPFCTFTSLH